MDDAVGETFDKVAKILKLNYPGGPEIENKSKKGNEFLYKLPIPVVKNNNLNMSFSGIKTAVNILVKKNILNDKFVADMCASFQLCISKVLIEKLSKIIQNLKNKKINISSVSLVGGSIK